jgi:16S rRNA (guanine527-N7)-methyltransferase
MHAARIADLLQPFLSEPLSAFQLEQISIYIDLLQRWNARINLTAIRNEEEIVTRHFGESLFLARHIFSSYDPCRVERRASPPVHPDTSPRSGTPISPRVELRTPTHVVDIGSGAGFPALPIKIYAPAIRLTMIESNHKKATFLREVIRTLTLTNVDASVEVRAERAEALASNPSFPRANCVTFRAVEKFDQTLKQATTLLAPDGTLALLIGSNQRGVLKTIPEFQWADPIPVPLSESRIIQLGQAHRSGVTAR